MVSLMSPSIPVKESESKSDEGILKIPAKSTPVSVPREMTTLRCRLCGLQWDRYYPGGSAVSAIADEEISHLLDSGCKGNVDIVSTQVKIVPISILELVSPSEDPGSRRDPVGK